MATTPDRKAVPETSLSMIAITEAQKQALVDNLQLEITERARKLRAQSALQAQALRVRLEVRVNRIPQALRKTNMQDLLEKYSAKAEVPSQKSATVPVKHKETTVSPVMNRGVKRASDALHASDKENEAPEVTTLDNPKKRAKIAAPTVAANTAAKDAKAVTRKPVPAQVLSPKSHNSRTLPTSPIKIASPTKSYMPRPASPAKPLLTGPPPTAKPARAPSRQAKRPAPVTNVSSQSVQQEPQRKPSARNSSDSDSTATTTIMKKTTTTTTAKSTKAAPAPAAKKVGGFKSAIASLTGSKRGKKAAEAAPAPVPEPAKTTTIGGRTLRKRGSTAKTIVTATTTAAARPLPSRANTTASNVSSKSTAAASTKSSATTSTTRAKVKGIVQSFRVIPRNEVRKSISKLAGEQKRRSSAVGVKRFGSRRLGKAVEKGRALFSSPGKKI